MIFELVEFLDILFILLQKTLLGFVFSTTAITGLLILTGIYTVITSIF